jgi:DUF4097 and DUF4098 domain-containing protein YvlB
MRRSVKLAEFVLATGLAALTLGCGAMPASSGHFDRTLTVTGPVVLDLRNGSGNAQITPGQPGQVKIHGDFTVRAWPWESSERRATEITANPPIEQSGGLIRIGGQMFRIQNLSVNYTIEVPVDTEMRGAVGSGEIHVRGIHGPARLTAGSGTLDASQIAQDAEATAGSGTVNFSEIGGQVQVTVGSGDVKLSGVEGETRVRAGSGDIVIEKPSGRVTASTGSGDITLRSAAGDLRLKTGSGDLDVEGNPSPSSSWEFHTASGDVALRVPSNASFRFYAHSYSGSIETGIPMVIEERPKHELRARVGDGQAQVEVETASGDISLH